MENYDEGVNGFKFHKLYFKAGLDIPSLNL